MAGSPSTSSPIRLLGMTNIGDGGVVMFALSLPPPPPPPPLFFFFFFKNPDNPMLDADTLPSRPIRPTGDVARCKDTWRAGQQELVDYNAGAVKSVWDQWGGSPKRR